MISDTISDMITRIRNANMRSHRDVSFDFSKFKLSICEKLKDNNFILENWLTKDGRKIKIRIRYFNEISSINEIEVISKPSFKVYVSCNEIKSKCKKKGLYLISTSKGLMTHKEALKNNIGGKIILSIN